MARYNNNLCLESKTDKFKLEDIMRLINNWKKLETSSSEPFITEIFKSWLNAFWDDYAN